MDNAIQIHAALIAERVAIFTKYIIFHTIHTPAVVNQFYALYYIVIVMWTHVDTRTEQTVLVSIMACHDGM